MSKASGARASIAARAAVKNKIREQNQSMSFKEAHRTWKGEPYEWKHDESGKLIYPSDSEDAELRAFYASYRIVKSHFDDKFLVMESALLEAIEKVELASFKFDQFVEEF